MEYLKLRATATQSWLATLTKTSKCRQKRKSQSLLWILCNKPPYWESNEGLSCSKPKHCLKSRQTLKRLQLNKIMLVWLRMKLAVSRRKLQTLNHLTMPSGLVLWPNRAMLSTNSGSRKSWCHHLQLFLNLKLSQKRLSNQLWSLKKPRKKVWFALLRWTV